MKSLSRMSIADLEAPLIPSLIGLAKDRRNHRQPRMTTASPFQTNHHHCHQQQQQQSLNDALAASSARSSARLSVAVYVEDLSAQRGAITHIGRFLGQCYCQRRINLENSEFAYLHVRTFSVIIQSVTN